MTRAQLRISLALWRRRMEFRRKRRELALAQDDAKRIAKWHRLHEEAEDTVRLRKRQLAVRSTRKQVWMTGVRKLPRTSAGGWAVSCPPRGVLHTTEGMGDATETLDRNRSWPHFQVERNGRITQYLPVDQAARTLEHPGGTVETNRAHAVQIEVVGMASQPEWPAEQKAAMRKVMRFIEDNAGVERASHVRFGRVGDQTHRLGATGWLKLRGWCGHAHVPNNDHTDPGLIKIGELL